MAPHVQRRRAVDARQMGIPLVRRLGLVLPRPRPDTGRCRLRQGTDAAHAPRAIHAPQWSNTSLRVELRRRQSARARLGHHLHLSPGKVAERKGDTKWLKSCFQKLLLNFTWWVNRKDRFGR